jgi:hypothetical protein
VLDWTLENLSVDDVARLRSIYEPLTESVRALIDATVRTEVDAGLTRTDGVKTFTAGHLADDEGITVEADGVFIQSWWARD